MFLLRGFGFVTFADPESIEKVLKVGRHEIDEKMVRDKTPLLLFHYHKYILMHDG